MSARDDTRRAEVTPQHVAMDVSNLRTGLTNGLAVLQHNLVLALRRVAPEVRLTLLFSAPRGTLGESSLAELSNAGAQVVRIGFAEHRVPAGRWWYPLQPTPSRLVGPVDVFHAGDFLRPRVGATPIVAAVADLTPRLFPQYHTRRNRLREAVKLRWVRTADRVLTISEATRADLVRYLGVDARRIDIAYPARGLDTGDEGGVPQAMPRAGGRLVLSVGTIEPRKNHARLLQAFESLADEFPDARLIIAGGPGWKSGAFLEQLETSTCRDRVQLTGPVTPAELRDLYRSASIVAYPSLYEGFGLPVLEAMAAGVPVLTSTASSLPEVAGDAALLVDPMSVDSIASGLRRMLSDESLREALIARGIEREKRFTWDNCAMQTLECYRKAMARILPD